MRRYAGPAAAVVVALSSSASVATAATCNQLHGTNLAKSRAVKIVKTRLHAGRSRYFGCVLPHGTAHPIGGPVGPDVGGYETTQHIDRLNGRFVAVTYSQSAGTETSDDSRVYNLATGRSYLFAHAFVSESESDYYDLGSAVRTILATKGRLVASYSRYVDNPDPNGDQLERATIAAFSATGKRRILDEGPASSVIEKSLKVVGRTASWTSGGRVKTYTLS